MSGPHPNQPGSRQLRVLVVDDDDDCANSSALILSLSGYDVRVASSGPKALEIARAYQPDVVLLDLALPGMDGFVVAQRLHMECTGKPPVIVAVSGYASQDYRDRSAKAGIQLHLAKPVDWEELRHFLETVRSEPEA